ncbi:MAG: hypothetical protein WC775_01520 [Patescibacteria group bacterium]|jgi:hypothetical protein
MIKKFAALVVFVFLALFPVNHVYAAPSFVRQPTSVGSATVPKYGKFEASFDISTTAQNKFFPYDTNAPSSRGRGTGVSVDMMLSPGTSLSASPKTVPCFYYQPVEEVRKGSDVAKLLPTGSPEWRCRFAPDQTGTWAYRVRVQDSSGSIESNQSTFTATSPTGHGFITVSKTDPRFFEFSDGTTFAYPLITTNFGSSLNTIRSRADALGNNGIRFIRWFPTGEDGVIVPFGDELGMSWGYGPTWATVENPDTAKGKLFSFEPYYYTGQNIPAKDGATYKLEVRAKIDGQKRFIPELYFSNQNKVSQTISANGGWQSYSLTITNTSNNSALTVYLHDGISEDDGNNTSGTISLGSIELRQQISPGVWGPNLIERGDPNTFETVDQIAAAKLDEVLRKSEEKGIYNKLTLFHKNDMIFDQILPDGTTGKWNLSNFYSPLNSASYWLKKAYVRYFVARWAYSTSLHSLELANENDVGSQNGFDMSLDLANYIHTLSPRRVLMSNSFWHWNGLSMSYWADPDMDYADKHWYADTRTIDCAANPAACDVVSATWQDTVLNVRQCYTRFKEYAQDIGVTKPVIRGETGVAKEGTGPQLGDKDGVTNGIPQETTGTYYLKKIWAQIGVLGFSCDGEWYPRLWETFSDQLDPNDTKYNKYFPTSTNSVFKYSKNYESYIAGEHLSNGNYVDIGTDGNSTNGIGIIQTSNANLRAFGARDSKTGRVLVWVDNKNNTWKNPNYNTAAAGSLTISVPNGNYTQEVWDTRSGTHSTSPTKFAVTNGQLIFPVSTAKDIAYKFYDPDRTTTTPSSTPIPVTTVTPSHCSPLGNIDCLGKVSALDLTYLVSKYGSNDHAANLNDMGTVNSLDLTILLGNYGK